ncbi:hypothetical protein BDN72DRAFT_860445 [Pluteus cervinus]|uniref:Uncharacterized protein n=1 Tax=Pluteus cervinus TaxID=181527 RepID=A0ACD3AJ28_9AGAR|nr:hypothetical protein BDN72DRAFT_860445 [Pluteus cervinus]
MKLSTTFIAFLLVAISANALVVTPRGGHSSDDDDDNSYSDDDGFDSGALTPGNGGNGGPGGDGGPGGSITGVQGGSGYSPPAGNGGNGGPGGNGGTGGSVTFTPGVGQTTSGGRTSVAGTGGGGGPGGISVAGGTAGPGGSGGQGGTSITCIIVDTDEDGVSPCQISRDEEDERRFTTAEITARWKITDDDYILTLSWTVVLSELLWLGEISKRNTPVQRGRLAAWPVWQP